MPKLTENLETRMRQYDGKYHTFKSILDQTWWYEKMLLGEKFTVWKQACLYTFLTDPNCHTDLDYVSGDIISEFEEKIAEIEKMTDKTRQTQLYEALYWATRDVKYLCHLEN